MSRNGFQSVRYHPSSSTLKENDDVLGLKMKLTIAPFLGMHFESAMIYWSFYFGISQKSQQISTSLI